MQTEMSWTVESVKRELPDINVRLPDGLIVRAQTLGRKLPTCNVWVVLHGLNVRQEVAWKTVCRALNEGRPLEF
jgi:hypothetical protein